MSDKTRNVVYFFFQKYRVILIDHTCIADNAYRFDGGKMDDSTSTTTATCDTSFEGYDNSTNTTTTACDTSYAGYDNSVCTSTYDNSYEHHNVTVMEMSPVDFSGMSLADDVHGTQVWPSTHTAVDVCQPKCLRAKNSPRASKKMPCVQIFIMIVFILGWILFFSSWKSKMT